MSLRPVCPVCSEANPSGFRFCGQCGTALPVSTARELSEERRLATVAFADLSGFTRVAADMDPEDLRSLIDGCMATLGGTVEEFGGTVDKVIGDALMAVFGAPVAHEDDAERAVRAALKMQQRASDRLEGLGGFALTIGVNTGEVMFAPVGPESHREFTVMGDAVNVAARLQAAALPSTVLVGRETHAATHRTIRYQELDSMRLKGKQEPVPAWLAVEPLTSPTPRPSVPGGMLGRAAELDLLAGIWQRAVAERRVQFVTVVGAPGIGKSRLADEFVRGTPRDGAVVLRGRSRAYGESTGYDGFADVVRQAAGIFETDATAEARAKLDHLVHGVVGAERRESTAEALSALVGLTEHADVADRTTLYSSARDVLEGLARQRPTVFIFEDLHWADQSQLDLVEWLSAHMREVPALILVLARPELLDARPHWGGGLRAYTVMSLDALTQEEGRELADRLLPPKDRSDSAVERIVARAGGNPLFLEELAAGVREGSATGNELPGTVKGMIAARLDTLPAPERRLLLDAAIIGLTFWRGAVSRLGDSATTASRSLEALEARDLIRRETASIVQGDEEFSFKHALIHEVAYATLPKSERRSRHGVAARFLEEAGTSADGCAAMLAHHWREAAESERAIPYLLTAAEQAGRGWAKAEAVGFYNQALELLPDGDARIREVNLKRAVAYQRYFHGSRDMDAIRRSHEQRSI